MNKQRVPGDPRTKPLMNPLSNKIRAKKYVNCGFFRDSVLGNWRMQQQMKISRTTKESGYKMQLQLLCAIT